jgi:hypothetical protein
MSLVIISSVDNPETSPLTLKDDDVLVEAANAELTLDILLPPCNNQDKGVRDLGTPDPLYLINGC